MRLPPVRRIARGATSSGGAVHGARVNDVRLLTNQVDRSDSANGMRGEAARNKATDPTAANAALLGERVHAPTAAPGTAAITARIFSPIQFGSNEVATVPGPIVAADCPSPVERE
jgi:hypothetical protein